jgi:hypothetical protein
MHRAGVFRGGALFLLGLSTRSAFGLGLLAAGDAEGSDGKRQRHQRRQFRFRVLHGCVPSVVVVIAV